MTGTRHVVETDIGRGYDVWAPGYDAQDNPMVAAVERHLRLHPLDFADARVLDIGCGTGRVMARALEAGAAHATGVDGSSGMLSRAAARLAAPIAAGRATLVEGDLAGVWPLPSAAFELAVIVLVLEHARSLAPILANAARHVAPGGTLFIAEIHPDMLRTHLGGHFEHDGTRYALPSHPHDQGEFTAALATAGFVAPLFREMRADEATIAAIPKFGRRAGSGVLLTALARRAAPGDLQRQPSAHMSGATDSSIPRTDRRRQ
jgi:SAM-dependent methyltransferase